MAKIEGSIGPAGLGFGTDAQLIVQNPTSSSFTLQNAIDETVDDKGDVILVLRGYQAPTATVNFNKKGITVMSQDPFGMNMHGRGEFNGIDTSHTTGPAGRVTKKCALIGLGFFGNQATGDDFNAALILDNSGAAGDGWGTLIKFCRLGNWEVASVNYGIFNKGMPAVTVDRCTFVGGATTNVLDAGILHDESITAGGGRPGEISTHKCRFEHCTYAHEVVNGSRVVNAVWDGDKMGFNAVAAAWVKMLKLNGIGGGGGAVNGAHIMNCNFATGIDTLTFSHTHAQLITEGYQLSGNNYGSDLSQLA